MVKKQILIQTKQKKIMLKNILFGFFICTAVATIQAQTPKPQLIATESEALLHILLTDMEDRPRGLEKLVITGQNSQKSYEVTTQKDGKFDILLPEGDTYSVRVKGWGEGKEFTTFDLENTPGIIDAALSLGYEPEKSFTLENVHFQTAKATLKPESLPSLNELVELLQRKQSIHLQIAGHTDNEGDDLANQKLSEARAKAVVDYLVSKGVLAKRLISKGFGESQPVADNQTPEGRAKNRRTEALILQE